jgi:hypothetical protein
MSSAKGGGESAMRKWLWFLIIILVIAAASVLTVTVVIPLIKYNRASAALNEGRYEEAIAAFAELGDYKGSTDKLLESRYKAAEVKLNNGLYEQAMQDFLELGSYLDSSELYREARYRWGTALIDEKKHRDALELFKLDMEYPGVEDEIRKIYGQTAEIGKKDVAYDAAVLLRDFKAIADLNLQVIAAGRNHVVALRRDGTVVAAGNNDKGQCNVQDWTDIIAVAAGFEYTVGLRSDGTIVAVGSNNNGQCNVQDWTDIVEIYAGNTATDTIGVKSDGTIAAAGRLGGMDYINLIPGKTESMLKVIPGFRGIIVLLKEGNIKYIEMAGNMEDLDYFIGLTDAAIGTGHAVGLRFDGTVVSAGRSLAGQDDVKDWTNIIAVAASNSNTAGLRSDGTVLVAGDNKKGQKEAKKWEDVVSVSVGPGYIVGLKMDGTVAAVGRITGTEQGDENEKVLEEIASWQGIGPTFSK